MTQRLERPDWVRRLNLMATSIGGSSRSLVPIDADQLLSAAAESFGELPAGDLGDPQWQERFRELVTAIDASPMHVLGRLMTKQELLRSLLTRLCLTQRVDDEPGIVESPVVQPVIVTGPARSGTSILFELLALDPTLRAPTAAEALHPLWINDSDSVDAFALSECEQEFWADVQPEFLALHELRSDLPVECVTLTQGSFCGFHWSMIARLDGWRQDPSVNYAYERAFLQVLQHVAGATSSGPSNASSRNWLLKTPAHLMLLPLLFAAFPDAWVIQTHRDPVKTMPSTVSISAMIQWMRTDEVDVDAVAASVLATFSAGLNGSIKLRSRNVVPSERFVDIHFSELLRDPVATMSRAYEQMGRSFTDDHAAAVLSYLAHKPKGKFGVHRYTPEEWGLTAESLRAEMAPYIEHFGVAREG